jgi:hypothetical protein
MTLVVATIVSKVCQTLTGYQRPNPRPDQPGAHDHEDQRQDRDVVCDQPVTGRSQEPCRSPEGKQHQQQRSEDRDRPNDCKHDDGECATKGHLVDCP